MRYRKLGNTGMVASEIGFGAEHLDGKPYEQVEAVVHEVLDQGINIMDCFMPGQEIRSNLAKALGDRRKDMIIQGQIGSTDINKQYDISRDLDSCKRYFDDLLVQLKTDYIDLGLLYFIDTEEDFQAVFDGPIIDYAQDLKRQGVIKALGFTSHNPETALKVVKTGLVEVMLFSINLAFDMMADDSVFEMTSFEEGSDRGIDPKRMELYHLCEQKNIAITVMKTYAAGKLLSPELTPFDRPMTPGQCIHYALTRPAVSSVLLGFDEVHQVQEAMDYYQLSDEEKDYTPFMMHYKGNFQGKCVYCSHCQPCPVKIDIAGVTRLLDTATLDSHELTEEEKASYATFEHPASACIKCGHCEKRCPFGVPIIDNMQKAADLFEA